MAKGSFVLHRPAVVAAWASVAGKKEMEGPLGGNFDVQSPDPYWGQKTWEQAERVMQERALDTLISKAGGMEPGLVLSGDLLNQCTSSGFALRNRGLPALGLYGACSTMAEALVLGGLLISGGQVDSVAAMTSSHFATAERQYRFPLGYGSQRPPTAQWTVTGAAGVLLRPFGTGPSIDAVTVGNVVDLGISDANNMGAAMAPAAWDTILRHLEDLHRSPEDFDGIFTGDLGKIGEEIVSEQMDKLGISLKGRYWDCGTMIFDLERQNVQAGGSGCGCSALVLCGKLLDALKYGKWKRILFCGTGALLSSTTIQQKDSIPGICHAVSISAEGGFLV